MTSSNESLLAEVEQERGQKQNNNGTVQHLHVAVRVRPLPKDQVHALRVENGTTIVVSDDDQRSIGGRGALSASSAVPRFVFDSAFDAFASSAAIYESMGRPAVKDVLLGFNAAIFAYGQTSSGKSHTMMGSASDPGLVPMICAALFYCTGKMKTDCPPQITSSFYEVYNEKVHDLLNPEFLPLSDDDDEDALPERKPLPVREHRKLGVFVDGLTAKPVATVDDVGPVLMIRANSFFLCRMPIYKYNVA